MKKQEVKPPLINTDVAKIILGVLGSLGLVSMIVFAPNAIQHLEAFGVGRSSYRRRYYLNKAVNRLKERGLIIFRKNAMGESCLGLTPKGFERLRKYEFEELTIKRPWRWDKKYRLIIFDIKEWKRGIRNQLRRWLMGLGFVRLQNSVWVHPYECREVIILLKSHFRIGREVLYLTVESIENDKWLKQHWGLE